MLITAEEFVEKHFKDYEYKDKLLANIRAQHYQNELYEETKGKKHFLASVMLWSTTQEGEVFWREESKKLN